MQLTQSFINNISNHFSCSKLCRIQFISQFNLLVPLECLTNQQEWVVCGILPALPYSFNSAVKHRGRRIQQVEKNELFEAFSNSVR